MLNGPSPTRKVASRNGSTKLVDQGLKEDVPIYAKRTESAASNNEFSEAEEAPASAEANHHDMDLAAAQQAAVDRLRATWESIFEKYGDESMLDEGDVIDLETGEIVENRGHLMSMKTSHSVWSDPRPVEKPQENEHPKASNEAPPLLNASMGGKSSSNRPQVAMPKNVDLTPRSEKISDSATKINDSNNKEKASSRVSLAKNNTHEINPTPKKGAQSPASFTTPTVRTSQSQKKSNLLEEDAFDSLITPTPNRRHKKSNGKRRESAKQKRSSLHRASQSPIRKLQYNVPASPRHRQLTLDDDEDQLISPAASQMSQASQPLSPLARYPGHGERGDDVQDKEAQGKGNEGIQYIEYFTVDEIEPLPIGKHEQVAEPDSAYRYSGKAREITNSILRRIRTRSAFTLPLEHGEDVERDVEHGEHGEEDEADVNYESLSSGSESRQNETHSVPNDALEGEASVPSHGTQVQESMEQIDTDMKDAQDGALPLKESESGLAQHMNMDEQDVDHNAKITNVEAQVVIDNHAYVKNNGGDNGINHENSGSKFTESAEGEGMEVDDRQEEWQDDAVDDEEEDVDDDDDDEEEEEEDDADDDADESLIEITEQQFHKATMRISEVLQNDLHLKFEQEDERPHDTQHIQPEPSKNDINSGDEDTPFAFADTAAQDRRDFFLELENQIVHTGPNIQACGVNGYVCDRTFCFTCS